MKFDHALWEALGKKFPRSRSSSRPVPSVEIGTDEAGKKITLPIEDGTSGLSATHMYVLGGSGVGKTKGIEGVMRSLIRRGYGVVLLDGKGDEGCLYDNIVDYCAYLDYKSIVPTAKKTILLDPNNKEYSVPLNGLKLLGDSTSDVLARLMVERIKKLYKEDSEFQPWLEEWLRPALIPLIEAKLTLVELDKFLSVDDPRFRDAVLSQVNIRNKAFKEKWDEFQHYKPMEQALRVGSIKTRSSTFQFSDTLRGIFGQKTTIDWLKVMKEGGIVLAKLGTTPRVTEQDAAIIGATILQQIMLVASERKKAGRRPFFFIVDEFQRFVTKDFAEALTLMRSYGISFILSHQHRDQFIETVPEVAKSIDSCCRNKIIFSCEAEDAETIVPNIYSNELYEDMQIPKDEIQQTKFRPIKTEVEIVTNSTATTRGKNTVQSSHDATSSLPGGIHSSIIGQGEGASDSVSHTSARSVARVPFVDSEEFQETSSRTYPSREEVKAKYIARIQNQPRRSAAWKHEDDRAITIRTPTIGQQYVTDYVRTRFKEASYAMSPARYTADVLEEVDGRVEDFLNRVSDDAKKPQTATPSTQDPDEKDFDDAVDAKTGELIQ